MGKGKEDDKEERRQEGEEEAKEEGKEGNEGTRCTLREGRGHMQMQWGSHLRRQGEIQDKACRWQHRLQQWRIWRPGPWNRESMLLQRRQEGEEEAKEEGKEGNKG